MKFIFDENLSLGLARGLREFGEDVEHINEYLPRGSTDEEILEFIGGKGYFLVTKDLRIRYNPAEIKALKEFSVGAFFLLGKNMGNWDIVKQVIKSWENIKEIAEKKNPPFAYKIYRHGKLVQHSID